MTDHKNLAAALAAFQAEMPTVHKGKKANVGQYSYSYADLADITEAVAPVLAKHGLAYAGSARHVEGGRYEVVGILSHASGEHREGALPIPGGNPQQVGSAITYMRRYLLGVMTGVVTDEDDDGAAASRPAPRQQQAPQRQQARAQTRKAAGKPTPAPQQDTGEAVTDHTRKHLFALMGQAPGLESDDDMQRAFLTDTLGRDVESRASLTEAEAKRAIDRLTAWQNGAPGAAWDPFGGDAA